jgi:hypothetical protein
VSFDLVVLSGKRPLDADGARDAYHHVSSGADWKEVLQEDARVAQFVAGLTARWPDAPLEVYESPAHVLLSISGRAPDEVIEYCESMVSKLGLNLFDPQDGTLYSPGQEQRKASPLPQKTLICEHCGRVIEPGTPHGEYPKVMHMECLFKTLGS